MHRFPVWFALFQASVVAWVLLEVWIFGRDRRAVRGERADRGSLWGMIALIGGGVFVAFSAVRGAPGARIEGLQPWGLAVGVALMWLGIALRSWAVLTLGAFFRVKVVLHDQHRLVTAGPYARLRHPSYTGAILTMLGAGLALGNWVSLAAISVGAVLAFGLRIRVEEAALRSRFGPEWAAFAAHRWALIPFVW